MVLPVTLGADTFTYAFALLGINIAFNLFGTVDIFHNLTKQLNSDVTKLESPKGIYLAQSFSLLLHGGILGLLIWNYMDSWKNAKDNALLVLMTIVLGLNLADFFFKTYKYWNQKNLDKDAPTVMNSIHIVGFVSFVTVAISYPWVGSFADQTSTSRIVVLTTGILVILVFGIGMLTIYRYNKTASVTLEKLVKSAGVKLNVQPKSGVKTTVYHEPTSIRGLEHPLTDDNPDTPLLLHAADKARFNPVPGITADKWKVLKYNDEHYLVSPEVAKSALQLQAKWTAEVNDMSNHTGDIQFWLHDIYKPQKSGASGAFETGGIPAKVDIIPEKDFRGYNLFTNKVHGWAAGLGVFFAIHWSVPACFTLFMFSWYSLYLQQFTSAILASVITLAAPLLFSVIGFTGQYWELFRWYFLIGWSLINLTNYIVQDQDKYIRQQTTWNVTTIPVQEFPAYTSADQSLQILGFAWVAFAWSCLALAVVIGTLIKKRYIDGIQWLETAQLDTKFSKEETTRLVKNDEPNLVRRSKYLTSKN